MRKEKVKLIPLALTLAMGALTVLNIPKANSQESETAAANNQFGFKLLAKLNAQAKNKNIFISPLSIGQVLKMAAGGAEGATREEINKALSLPAQQSVEEMNKNDARMIDTILKKTDHPMIGMHANKRDTEFKLTIANSLWANEQFALNKSFVNTCSKSYNAMVQNLNFADPSSVGKINSWASQNTNGKIPSILQRLSASQLMVLVNATYFKAAWMDQFTKQATQDADFHTGKGDTKKVPMMQTGGKMIYSETDKYQIISLPYADQKTCMYIILPNKEVATESLMGIFENEWTKASSNLSSKRGVLYLPRFKFDYSTQLADPLSEIGMKLAFTEKANFLPMVAKPPSPFVSEVIHKTYVDVNEEGTEAAAVTAMVFETTAMRREEEKPFVMRVDRPFIFAIANRSTNAILFLGTVDDPTQ